MIEPDDWRLTGQENYLMGVNLCRKRYRRYSDKWDHDHCEFCWKKFAEEDFEEEEILHAGYATPDNYRWICDACFVDFKDMFKWKVIDCPREEES